MHIIQFETQEQKSCFNDFAMLGFSTFIKDRDGMNAAYTLLTTHQLPTLEEAHKIMLHLNMESYESQIQKLAADPKTAAAAALMRKIEALMFPEGSPSKKNEVK